MIGVKRAHPDSSRQDPPVSKRRKVESPPPMPPTRTPGRKKYRVKKTDVFVQVLDLGNDVRLVQKLYRKTRTFF